MQELLLSLFSLRKVNIEEKLKKERGNEVKEQGKGNCK